ncbi:MAG: YraN family protein [bacterium]
MKPARELPPHLHRGADAEQSALAYLRARGLELVARNYRCSSGELDLVMLDRRELVFVEVRYRNSDRFGGATRSVDSAKQRKLRRAGEVFLQQHPKLAFTACRFDVIALEGDAPGYRIDWISDAF